MKIQYLDKVIIEGIRMRDAKFENILFDRFRGIEQYNDAPEDVKFSLYVDTISDIILQIRNERNKDIENLKAYVKAIFKNKFNRYLKIRTSERDKYVDTDSDALMNLADLDTPVSLLEPNEENAIQEFVNAAFEKLSTRCKEIFQARFISGLKFSEIATDLNFSSENSAKNANHDCLKQARSKCKLLIKDYHGGI
tara:strand:- start:1528 stop:2112 length:585 start_codon:yes stop_codon:yes gene_type:complete